MTDRSPDASQQVVAGALQQAAIQEVYERHRGRPATIVAPALRTAFEEAGLSCPPEPWLMSVAAEIAAGQLYVVGSGLVADDPFGNPAAGPKPSEPTPGADHPVGDPAALWFNGDPKVDHVNPADAVEHAAEQAPAVDALRHSPPEVAPEPSRATTNDRSAGA